MKFTRLLTVLLALATGAFAQDNNAARLALAREAITAMKVDKMFDAMTAQMKQFIDTTGSLWMLPSGALPSCGVNDS